MEPVKVGDKVRCTKLLPIDRNLSVGTVYEVRRVYQTGDVIVRDDFDQGNMLYQEQYEKVTEEAPAPATSDNPLEVQIGGSHYKDMAIQPIEFCVANNIPFAEGNVIKYVSRWRKKGGVQDLKKARHMLDVLIEQQEKTNG
jgi:hypothetical protein